MTSILNDPHLPTATALAILTTCLWCGCGVPQRPATEPRAAMECAATYQPHSPEDEALLDDLQRRIVDYFWTEIFPETGIAIDHTENRVGKVAATGFGLAAICIGVERGWIPREEAYARVLKTLNAFWPDPDNPDDICVDGHFGLFWHFVDGHTGRMKPVDCVAICDSADFIAGVIVAGEYFKGTEIETLAKKIYDRVEWDQFVSRNPDGAPGLMSFGWVPLHVSENYYETDGLLNFNMSGFADNSLLIYPLALGSETHPIPQETWEQYVNTYTLDEYEGHECVFAGQLFSRQVPAAFIPFSRKRDRKIDYFLDTVNAILADRAFNMKENRYPPQLWGLTDAFGKDSYVHSAPPGPIANNGTVGTTAFAGALPHVPALSLEAMHYVREKFGDRVYGKYGFSSTVNAQTGFVSPLYVGIELGPMIMLIENYRSGLIWNLFARSRVMKNFVERAGISGVVDDFELPSEAPPYALWNAEGAIVARSDDRPQHGRFCLAITPTEGEFILTGQLTENDLLQYHFSKYLSLWTRDMDLTTCSISMDGNEITLPGASRIEAGEWIHHYFALPPHSETSRICGLTLATRATGPRPALDNISLEPRLCQSAPNAVDRINAAPGTLPESVELRWTAPEHPDGERITRYLVSIEYADGGGKQIEILAATAPGEEERRMILVGAGATCSIRMTAIDRHGHRSAESQPVTVTATPGILNRVAYDFKDGSIEGWQSTTPDIQLRVDDLPDGRALRMDYTKTHGWLYVTVTLDPRMVALHRNLKITLKGRGTLLAKLWCSEILQEDIRPITLTSEKEWITATLDTRLAVQINTSRDEVKQLLLFPAPSEWSGSGTFWIRELSYAE